MCHDATVLSTKKQNVSCSYLERSSRNAAKNKERASRPMKTLRVDFKTRTKLFGAKEKARKKKCYLRFSLARRSHLKY